MFGASEDVIFGFGARVSTSEGTFFFFGFRCFEVLNDGLYLFS